MSSKEVEHLLSGAEEQLFQDPSAALKQAKQARRASEQLGAAGPEAKAALLEARAQLALGQAGEAAKAAAAAVGAFQKAADREGEANLALSEARGDGRAAAEEVVGPLNKAVAIYRELGDKKAEASTLNKIGQAQLSAKPQDAMQSAKQAATVYRELGDPRGEGQALLTIVKAHLAKDEPQDALRVVKDRIASAGQEGKLYLMQALVTAHLDGEDPDAALDAALDGLELAREQGERTEEAWMLYKASEVHLNKEEVQEALQKASEALEIFQEAGDREGELAVSCVLTVGYTMSNEAHKAPHRMAGLEQLGKLVEAVTAKDKPLFFEAFEKLNSCLGVDKQDFDSVLKPVFRRDIEAEEFYRVCSFEYYGVPYQKDVRTHLKKGKTYDRMEMFLGQRWGSMGYGPSFRSVQATIRRGDPYYPGSGSHALSIIQDQTAESWEEVAMFTAHPGMMDAALQVQGIPHNR